MENIKTFLYGILLTAVFAITQSVAENSSDTTFILPCRRLDEDLNGCIKNSFHHLKNFLPHGIPEIGVPPLEPLHIDELTMENNAGAVRIKARFSNIIAKGASNYTVKEVRNDLKNLRFDMSIGIPRVEVVGKYDVLGNVLLLPVRSNGNFWAEFSNISAIARIFGEEKKRDDKVYLHIKKLVIDFTMKNARFKVEDNLNAQNVLGEAINNFLNQNSRELVQEMRPAASQSIAKLFQKILNNAFSIIELNKWLLD